MKFSVALQFLAMVVVVSGQRYLAVEDGEFRLNGEKIFRSGMNIAWSQYGADFGNGNYEITGPQLEKYIRDISNAGGNSIRIWLHCNSWFTPLFDENGYVMGTDESNTLIEDLSNFLDVAYENNILVNLVLWTGAGSMKEGLRGLVHDESKLESYIDNALIPMVSKLSIKVALASWEIMNEPEGSILIGSNPENPCFDTSILQGSGAGWTGENIPMEKMLKFINVQIAAIKRQDPKALVTVGSWGQKAQTDNFGFRNFYKDECLIAAGGDDLGVIDFHQMHCYARQGHYEDTKPLMIRNDEYGLHKPNVIGEFSQEGGDGRDISDLFEWTYTQGYSGGWSWQANAGGNNADDFDTQAKGTQHLKGRDGEGGKIDIHINFNETFSYPIIDIIT